MHAREGGEGEKSLSRLPTEREIMTCAEIKSQMLNQLSHPEAPILIHILISSTFSRLNPFIHVCTSLYDLGRAGK